MTFLPPVYSPCFSSSNEGIQFDKKSLDLFQTYGATIRFYVGFLNGANAVPAPVH